MDELGPVGIQEVGEGAWGIPALGIIIRLKPLSAYTQNATNPVKHSPRNFGTVLQSIQKLGALRSGFSSHGRILGGNLTYEAMAEAGIEWVVEVESNGQAWLMHERPDLSEEQQQLAAYFDQQSALQAVWNAEQISADLNDGLGLTGADGVFYQAEVDAVLRAAGLFRGELDDAWLDSVTKAGENGAEPTAMTDVSFTFGDLRDRLPIGVYSRFIELQAQEGGIEQALRKGIGND